LVNNNMSKKIPDVSLSSMMSNQFRNALQSVDVNSKFIDYYNKNDNNREGYNNYVLSKEFESILGIPKNENVFVENGTENAKFNSKVKPIIIQEEDKPEKKAFATIFNQIVAGKGYVNSSFAQRTFNSSMTGGWAKSLGIDKLIGVDGGLSDFSFQEDGVYFDGHKLSLAPLEAKTIYDFAGRVTDADKEKSFFDKTAEASVSMLWDLPLMYATEALTAGMATPFLASARAAKGFGKVVADVAKQSTVFNIMGIPQYVDAVKTNQNLDVYSNIFLHNSALGAGAAVTGGLSRSLTGKLFDNIAVTKQIMRKNPAFFEQVGSIPGSFGFGYGSTKMSGGSDEDALATGLAFASTHIVDIPAYKRIINLQKTKDIKVFATKYDNKDNPLSFSHDYFLEENGKLFKIDNEAFSKGNIVKISDGFEANENTKKDLFFYNEMPNHNRLTYTQALEQVRIQKNGKKIYDRWTKELPEEYVKENSDKIRYFAELTAGSTVIGDMSKTFSRTRLPEEKELQNKMISFSDEFSIPYSDVKKFVFNNIKEFFVNPQAFTEKFNGQPKPMQKAAEIVKTAAESIIEQETKKETKSRLRQNSIAEVNSGGSRGIVKLEETETGTIYGGASAEKDKADAIGLLEPKYGVVKANDIVEAMTTAEIKKAAETGEFPLGYEELANSTYQYEAKGKEPIPFVQDDKGGGSIGNVEFTPAEVNTMKENGAIVDKTTAENKKGKAKVGDKISLTLDGEQVKATIIKKASQLDENTGNLKKVFVIKTDNGEQKIIPESTSYTVLNKGVIDEQKQMGQPENTQISTRGEEVTQRSSGDSDVNVGATPTKSNEEVNGTTQVAQEKQISSINEESKTEGEKQITEPIPTEKITPEIGQGSTNVPEGIVNQGKSEKVPPSAPIEATSEIVPLSTSNLPSTRDVFNVVNDLDASRGAPEYASNKKKFDDITDELMKNLPTDLSDAKRRTFRNDIQQLVLNALGISNTNNIVTGAKAEGVLKRYNEEAKIKGNYNQKSVDALRQAGILDYINELKNTKDREANAALNDMNISNIPLQDQAIAAEIADAELGTNVNLHTRKSELAKQAFGEDDEISDGNRQPLRVISLSASGKNSAEYDTLVNILKNEGLDPLDTESIRKSNILTSKEKNFVINRAYKEISGIKPSGTVSQADKIAGVGEEVAQYIDKNLTLEQAINKSVEDGKITAKEAEDYKALFNPYRLKQLYNSSNIADQPVDQDAIKKSFAERFGDNVELAFDQNINQEGVEQGKTRTAVTEILPNGKVKVSFQSLTGKDAPLEELIHVSAILTGDKSVNKLLKDLGSDGEIGSYSWGNAHEELFNRVNEFRQGYRPDEYGILSKVKEVWEKLKNFFTGHGLYSSAEVYRKLLDGDMSFRDIVKEVNENNRKSILNNMSEALSGLIRFNVKSTKGILDNETIKVGDGFWSRLKNKGVKDTEINYLKSFLQDGEKLNGDEFKRRVAEKLFPIQINVVGQPLNRWEMKDYAQEKQVDLDNLKNGVTTIDYIRDKYGYETKDKDALMSIMQSEIDEALEKQKAFEPSQQFSDMTTSGSKDISRDITMPLENSQASNYRILSFDMPGEWVEQMHNYWNNREESVGWARVEDEIIDGKKTGILNVNEIQGQLQYTNAPKWEDLKIGDKIKLIGESYTVTQSPDKDGYLYANNKEGEAERWDKRDYENSKIVGSQQEYLQSLKPIFHELQIKSLIQYAKDNGYNAVRFPTKESISKIERFNDIEKEIKLTEDIIPYMNEKIGKYRAMGYDKLTEKYKLEDVEHPNYSGGKVSNLELDAFRSRTIKDLESKLASYKQHLKDMQNALASNAYPVQKFYEESVGMSGRRLRRDNWYKARDAYGNEWFETKILPNDGQEFNLYNTSLAPNETTFKLFNESYTDPYKEKLKDEVSNEQWKEVNRKIIPQSVINENANKVTTFGKLLDHYNSTAKSFIQNMSQPLWVLTKLSIEKGGATKSLIDEITKSKNINEGRTKYIAGQANDILDGLHREIMVNLSPEEIKNIADLKQYFNNNSERVPTKEELPNFLQSLNDINKGTYYHYNNDGKESKVEWNKVSDKVWNVLRKFEENEINKQEIATENIKESLFRDKYGTVKRLLQTPTSKMGIDKQLVDEMKDIANAVFANPIIKIDEVMPKMSEKLSGLFDDGLIRLDDVKKKLNSVEAKKLYTYDSMKGELFDSKAYGKDKANALAQIKDYQNKVKTVPNYEQLALLIGRNAEANFNSNDPTKSVMSIDELADKLVGRWQSNASMDRTYSEPINYLAKLDTKDNFRDSYIPRTLPNEKFVLSLRKDIGNNQSEVIFREHYPSIMAAQEAIRTKLANKDGFIKYLMNQGQLTQNEADLMGKQLAENAFSVYHIKDEANYFDELGRKLGYFDLQRILNQVGANKDAKEIEQINNYLQSQMLNKRFEERKGIAGGSEELSDVIQSLKDLNSEMARRNSNNYMQLEISNLLRDYDKVVDKKDLSYIQDLGKEMLRTTKAENSIIAGIRNITYGAIMFNPRQWFTNATGLLSTGLPILAQYHHSRALPELFDSFKQGTRLLKLYKMEEAGKPLPTMLQEDEAMYPIFKTFAKAGNISPVLTEEQMTGETNAQRQLYKTSQKILGFGNIQVEEINRATALVAGYKIGILEAEKLVNEGKMTEMQAEEYAYNQAILTNAKINILPSINTPLALQKSRGVLRTLLKNQYMMKSFTHNYMHMYSQALKYGVMEGFKGSNKFDKGQLWAFAYANLPMLMLAGIGGVPFSTDMQNIIRAIFKKDTELEMRKFMANLPGILSSPEFSNFMLNGAPTLAGVDVSKSTGMGDVLAQTGLGELMDTITGLDAFKSQQSVLGGLKAGIDMPASTFSTMYKMVNGDWKSIVDTPPLQTISMIRNLTNAVKQSQIGLQTHSGDTLIKPENFTPYNIGMQALGFGSTKATNAKELKTVIDMITSDRSKASAMFKEQMMEAIDDKIRNGNISKQREVISKIRDWNENNAELGKPIIMRQIILSAINQLKNNRKDIQGREKNRYIKQLISLYNE